MYQLISNKFDFAFRYAPFPLLVANDAHFLPTFSNGDQQYSPYGEGNKNLCNLQRLYISEMTTTKESAFNTTIFIVSDFPTLLRHKIMPLAFVYVCLYMCER